MNAVDRFGDLLDQLGTGPWNYIYFATSTSVPMILPIYLIGSEFLNPPVTFSCDIPTDNRTRAFNGSQCLMITEDDAGEVTVPCKSWNYDTSVFHSTVSMEWDLVCDRAWLSPLFQTIYTVGCFIGAIFGGISADRFGRRWAVKVGIVSTMTATLLQISAPWFPLVMLARFLLGIFNTMMICPAFMLSMEVCETSLRPTVGVLLAVPYALMMIMFAGLAYLIRDWRQLLAAASWPFLVLLPLAFFVDESPRWLVVKGRLSEAQHVFHRAIKLNRPKFTQEIDLECIIHNIYQKQNSPAEASTEATSYSNGSKHTLGLEDGFGPWWAGPVALFRTEVIRNITLKLLSVWLLQGIVYLGLPLSSSAFSSPFLYMAMLGLFELPAYTLTAPITKRLGRRSVVMTCLLSSGLLLMVLLIMKETSDSKEWIEFLLVMLSYLCVCSAYQVNFLYAPELFPTSLRPWGTAACTLSAYVGFSIPPFITATLGNDCLWVPLAIFSTSGIIAGMIVFLLPETNGQNLSETVEDLHRRLKGEKLPLTASGSVKGDASKIEKGKVENPCSISISSKENDSKSYKSSN